MPEPQEVEKRCKAVRKGRRCGNRPMVGLEVCRMHGGATTLAKKKSEKAKMVRKMQAFVTPVASDDPEAHPIAAFESEFRRTLGRIRWYDEQLAQLSKDALTWGLTKSEDVGAAEFSGRNETYEAKANILHEMQFAERKHLVEMSKIWMGAHLDEQRLNIQRAYVMALDKTITGTLQALGLDVSDPAVRQVVRDQIAALPMRPVEA